MRAVILGFLMAFPPLLAVAEVPAPDGIQWCIRCGQLTQSISTKPGATGACRGFSQSSGQLTHHDPLPPSLDRLLGLSKAIHTPPFTPILFAI